MTQTSPTPYAPHGLLTLLSVSVLTACTGFSHPPTTQSTQSTVLQAAAVPVNSLPTDRFPPNGWQDTQWIKPLGWTTVDVSTRGLPPNRSDLDASQKVRDILSATSGRRILYFPPGAYYFKTDLVVAQGDLTLRGAGRSATFFYQQQTSNPGRIEFRGSADAATLPLNVPTYGSNQITLQNSSDAAGVAVGNLINIFQSYPDANTWGDPWATESWGQLAKVVSKSGNTLTLDMKLGLPYDAAYQPRMRVIRPVNNVRIESLRIERTVDNDENDSIKLTYCSNCLVNDIKSVKASDRQHVDIATSYEVVVENSDFSDAWTLTGGGYAYGVDVNLNSTKVRVSNNKFWNFRHHVVLQAGANHTVVSYNSFESSFYDASSSGSDMSLHGNWAHNNLFEGNVFSKHAHDGSHGPNGPRNMMYRNRGKLINVSRSSDTQNLVGNTLSSSLTVESGSSDIYRCANRVNGTVQAGAVSCEANLPASLYLPSQPAFLSSKPWPLFGPGVTDWGTGNVPPAFDRPR